MIPILDLEIDPPASEAEVPTDALMEEEETVGSSTEERSMSPLHQEEEVSPIVSREEFDLMTRVLDDQPILGSSVSGQHCIRSAGTLPLAKYHPYILTSFFKGQLHGLPSSEAFHTNYLRRVRGGEAELRRDGREADDECSGAEGSSSVLWSEGSADSEDLGVVEPGDGPCADATTLAACASKSHGDGRGIGWSWNFGRQDLG